MLSDKTHAVYRDLKGDSGFEGFRGSQEKGFRDSGIKNKAVAKFRFKFQALAVCSALMTFATTGWGQTTETFSTAGVTSWTVPAGVTSVTVECWGGGGSGGAGINGGGTTASSNAGGGGGGAYAIKAVSVTPGSIISLTVGAGGAAGTASNNGADSIFGSNVVVAKGGTAGVSVSGTSQSGAGGAGGAVATSVGDTKYAGGSGFSAVFGTGPGGGGGSSAGIAANGNNATSGTLAAAPTGGGAGGAGATSSGSGGNASSPGGGGGGAKTSSSAQRNGGAGGTGQVRLTYTLSATPTLTAAVSATVDGSFDVTFTDNSAWRSAITSITVGGTALPAGAYSVTAGKITFTPSASALLQSSESKSIAVIATGYNNAAVTQNIGVGAANKLAITTQPTAPARNGAAFATQPVVKIQDKYGNATTSTASVTASVGAGTWTLGGTASQPAVSGTATFTGLTATSAAAVSGATISFTSGSLTGVTSSTFDIPVPPANDLSSAPTSITVNGPAVNGTTAGADISSPFSSGANAYSDVWFSFTAPYTGTVYLTTTTTASSRQDLDLFAWSGSAPSTTSGGDIGGASSIDTTTGSGTISATAGTTYFIRGSSVFCHHSRHLHHHRDDAGAIPHVLRQLLARLFRYRQLGR